MPPSLCLSVCRSPPASGHPHCSRHILTPSAGYETTGAGLASTLYLLSCNPEAQRKLQEEVDQVLGGKVRRRGGGRGPCALAARGGGRAQSAPGSLAPRHHAQAATQEDLERMPYLNAVFMVRPRLCALCLLHRCPATSQSPGPERRSPLRAGGTHVSAGGAEAAPPCQRHRPAHERRDVGPGRRHHVRRPPCRTACSRSPPRRNPALRSALHM